MHPKCGFSQEYLTERVEEAEYGEKVLAFPSSSSALLKNYSAIEETTRLSLPRFCTVPLVGPHLLWVGRKSRAC